MNDSERKVNLPARISTEPRPGFKSTIYMEMVDENGQRMSDTTVTWYGGTGIEGRLFHNELQVALADAVNRAVESGNNFMREKAES